jgi:hypothetical protein
MKIYAPVKEANGIYASVRFVDGVGETDNPRLIKWFIEHGYKVEDDVKPVVKSVEEVLNDQIEAINDKVDDGKPDFEKMTPNELREWGMSHGYGGKIKGTRNKEKLLEILRG